MSLMRWGSVAVSSVLALAVLAGTAAAEPPPPDLQSQAVKLIASQMDIPAEALNVVAAVTSQYAMQARTVYRFKVVDTRPDGDVYAVSLDRDGKPIDEGGIEQAELKAREARYGQLDPPLFDRLARAKPDEMLDVVLWLREPEPRRSARLNPEKTYSTKDVQSFLAKVDADRAADVSRLAAPVMERLGDAATAFQYAPAIGVKLPASRVKDIASMPQVDRAYLGVIDRPELAVAGAFLGIPFVHSQTPPLNPNGTFTPGVRGNGVKLGLVEAQGDNVQIVGALGVIQRDPAYSCPGASRTHSTALAGILNSNDSVFTGMAPNASVFATGSCSGLDTELQAAATNAVNNGAMAVNMSFGAETSLMPTAQDRFFDDMVLHRLRQPVKSAGNLRPCSDNGGVKPANTDHVTSPGLAYNVLTVGSFDASMSTGMSACSSGGDPVSVNSDRQKPEVAAPGVNIRTTGVSGTFPTFTGGTSFAAPMVTGSAALMLQERPVLGSFPEVLRALFIATAIHEREPGTSLVRDHQGAGGIATDEAFKALSLQSGGWTMRNVICNGVEQPVGVFVGRPGQRMRIAVAWNSNTFQSPVLVTGHTPPTGAGGGSNSGTVTIQLPSGNWPDQPSADFDLVVRDFDGSIVAQSSSFDNTFELVDFAPRNPDLHTISVTQRRCDALNPTIVGMAMWKK